MTYLWIALGIVGGLIVVPIITGMLLPERYVGQIKVVFPHPLDDVWTALADFRLGRVALHARRHATDMNTVLDALTQSGIDPVMAATTVRRLRWCADLGLRDRFHDGPPQDVHAFVEAARSLDWG